jgi:Zn-dependent protease
MRPSVRFGTVAGIDVGVHWTVLVIALLLLSTLSGTVLPATAPGYTGTAYLLTAVVTAVLFLASIVAHELGHSLVARRNGVRVRGITLFALGGVATLDGEAPNPGAAARIAAAGPAVSIATGAGLLGLALGAEAAGLLPGLWVAGLAWLGAINLTLAVFNLLPALPLDGGRVLQALLWRRRGNRQEATIAAAKLGRVIGWLMILFGLWELTQGANGLITALIGWFVIATARAEARQAERELQAARGVPPMPPFGPFTWWGPPSGPPAGGPSGPYGPHGAGQGPPRGFGPQGPTPPRPGPYGGYAPPTTPPYRGEVIDVDSRPADAHR